MSKKTRDNKNHRLRGKGYGGATFSLVDFFTKEETVLSVIRFFVKQNRKLRRTWLKRIAVIELKSKNHLEILFLYIFRLIQPRYNTDRLIKSNEVIVCTG